MGGYVVEAVGSGLGEAGGVEGLGCYELSGVWA